MGIRDTVLPEIVTGRFHILISSEVVAVIEYDNNLKAALYPELMFIETALKNIVCNESVKGLKLGTFEHLYKERMSDNTTNTKLQSKRLKLRNSVYAKLAARYHDEEEKENQMVRHFYNRGEICYLSGSFLKYYILVILQVFLSA